MVLPVASFEAFFRGYFGWLQSKAGVEARFILTIIIDSMPKELFLAQVSTYN
jgi:hypothetical protein